MILWWYPRSLGEQDRNNACDHTWSGLCDYCPGESNGIFPTIYLHDCTIEKSCIMLTCPLNLPESKIWDGKLKEHSIYTPLSFFELTGFLKNNENRLKFFSLCNISNNSQSWIPPNAQTLNERCELYLPDVQLGYIPPNYPSKTLISSPRPWFVILMNPLSWFVKSQISGVFSLTAGSTAGSIASGIDTKLFILSSPLLLGSSRCWEKTDTYKLLYWADHRHLPKSFPFLFFVLLLERATPSENLQCHRSLSFK